MIALVCTTPHQFNYANIEAPKAPAGETLLKIESIDICGTDFLLMKAHEPSLTIQESWVMN